MDHYQYTAFISYRHMSPDEDIAKRLHTLLENYHIPKNVQKATGISKVGRVFRDQEELPLSGDLGKSIHTALKNSEWLILICSPRYLESKWCRAELEYFLSLGKKDHILAVIAEGEPHDVFPEEICYQQINGIRTEIEPLAADVRDADLKASLKKLDQEKLRILAPILGVNFDDLRQRARERRIRIITGALSACVILLASFLSYALIKNAQVRKQRDLALDNEMKLLIEQSVISSENDNKLPALLQLREAAELRNTVGTKNDERYGAALEYALYTDPFDTVLKIDTANRQLDSLVFSHNDRWLLGITNLNSACLIDAESGSIVYTVSRSDTGNVDSIGFTQDDRYFYMVDSWYGYVSVYSVETGELYREFNAENEYAMSIGEKIFPVDHETLLIIKDKIMILWNFENNTRKETLPGGEQVFDGYISPLIVDLAPDAKHVVIGSHGYGFGMKICTLEGSEEVQLEFDKSRGYSSMCYCEDGTRIAGVSAGMYSVWDAETGKKILDGTVGDTAALQVLISSDGKTLLAMTAELLRAIDIDSKKTLWEKTADSSIETEACLSPDGRYVSAEGGIRGVFDMKSGEELAGYGSTLFSHDGSKVIANTYQSDPQLLVTPAYATSTIEEKFSDSLYSVPRYTDPEENIQITLSHQAAEIYSTPPGSANRQSLFYTDPSLHYAAHTDYDGFIEVFDISDPKNVTELYCLAEHCFNSVTDLVFSRNLMASCGGFDPRCVIFDLEKGQIRFVLAADEYCHGSEFSKDGSKIIILGGLERNKAYVYSTLTGNLLYSFEAPKGRKIDQIGFTETETKVAAVLDNGSAMTGTIYPDIEEMIEQAKK